jgi:adenylate cyclase
MSGPEINANAIATLMAGEPLADAPGWVDALAIIALAALGALAAWPRRAWVTLVAAAGVGVAYLLLAQAAFAGGTVLAVSAPLLALALATVGGLAATYGILERERSRLRTEFARFVPAAVVDEVVDAAGEDQRLGGRRIYSSVMFADLRGFTAAAERLPPEAVIELLNRYLGEMSDAILDHGGTLVSYMGDGIMAIFGAPIEQADHADRAVAAAREMRDVRLPRFNAWCAERVGGEPFRIGIGVASGPVMSGNVGSQRRLEYAAVGDTTNIASRLQALTKEVPEMILLADTTRAALSRAVPDLAPVGALDVRGRQVPAGVWTLASPAGREPVSRA